MHKHLERAVRDLASLFVKRAREGFVSTREATKLLEALRLPTCEKKRPRAASGRRFV